MTDNLDTTPTPNRAQVEQSIEDLIDLLDCLDPDPDLEDNGDAEEEPDAEIEHDNEPDYGIPPKGYMGPGNLLDHTRPDLGLREKAVQS